MHITEARMQITTIEVTQFLLILCVRCVRVTKLTRGYEKYYFDLKPTKG